MENSSFLHNAEKVATQILKDKLTNDFSYHNFEYTHSIVEAVKEIGATEQLSAAELEHVQVAAWFQYTGFQHSYEGYVDESVKIAEAFLLEEKAAADVSEKILSCIRSTTPDRKPDNKLEYVLHDASKVQFRKGGYKRFVIERREELENIGKKRFTDMEWIQSSLDEVVKCEFYTAFGKDKLATDRDVVRLKLEKNFSKLEKKIDESLILQLGVSPAELKNLKKKLKKAEGLPERGIETMFRLTSKNHLDLSGMADTKANIMISVNSIIISILLGGLMQKLDSNPHLIVPTIILLAVNLGSIVFSILSVRPNITDGKFTREDIKNHKTNLLFFGNFHKMKREDYHWGMNRLMENANFLYSNLIDDIYFLGVVLARKYSLLRWSYNIFMYGIVVAVLSYVIANFLVHAQ